MPTRDEPVYVRVEGEHILGTLITPGSLVPGVLFVHGWGGDQRQYLARARDVAGLGCVCLTFDLRGHAQTQAQYESVSREESLRDVLAAYDFLAAQHNVDSDAIAVVGSSYGGYLAAMLTEIATGQVARAARAGVVQGLGMDAAEAQAPGRAGPREIPAAAGETRGKQGAAGMPVVHRRRALVESEHDTIIPHQVIVNYREACVSARSLTYRMIEGADHGLSSESMQAAYTGLLVKWFKEIVFGAKPAEPVPAEPAPASATSETAPAVA